MKPNRIQRERTKGWRMPEGAVYVGRPTLWGNPLKGTDALERYRMLWDRDWEGLERAGVGWNERFYLSELRVRWREQLPELRGKDLVCWCPLDKPCHADILLRKANA